MADVVPCQTTESGFMGRITGVPSRWQASCSNSTVPRPQAQKFRENLLIFMAGPFATLVTAAAVIYNF
jgi:hypothetical protein